MPNEYWIADEAAEIAEEYLGLHPDLMGAHIGYVFKTKASKRDGQPIVGKAKKVPEIYKPFMTEQDNGDIGFDFILEFGADAWNELNRDQKAAWVDHCLEQCFGEEKDDGTIKWKLRRPSIVAFPVILNRHGVQWDTGVTPLRTLRLNDQPTLTEPKVRQQEEPSVTQDVSS